MEIGGENLNIVIHDTVLYPNDNGTIEEIKISDNNGEYCTSLRDYAPHSNSFEDMGIEVPYDTIACVREQLEKMERSIK